MATVLVHRAAVTSHTNAAFQQDSPGGDTVRQHDVIQQDFLTSACALFNTQLSTVVDQDAGISLHPMPIHKQPTYYRLPAKTNTKYSKNKLNNNGTVSQATCCRHRCVVATVVVLLILVCIGVALGVGLGVGLNK